MRTASCADHAAPRCPALHGILYDACCAPSVCGALTDADPAEAERARQRPRVRFSIGPPWRLPGCDGPANHVRRASSLSGLNRSDLFVAGDSRWMPQHFPGVQAPITGSQEGLLVRLLHPYIGDSDTVDTVSSADPAGTAGVACRSRISNGEQSNEAPRSVSCGLSDRFMEAPPPVY